MALVSLVDRVIGGCYLAAGADATFCAAGWFPAGAPGAGAAAFIRFSGVA